MGKRPAGVELFEGNMASMQRERGRLCKETNRQPWKQDSNE
jgi:hypothetical protein